MSDILEKKGLSFLMKESWDFFSKRWIILFQISLFVWMPSLIVFSLAALLWKSYNSLKNNPELLFSFKVILAGEILFFTIIVILVFILLTDKLMKIVIIDKLWEKPEEKYYLEFINLLKEVWPKMRGFFDAEFLVWIIVLAGCLFLLVPGVLFIILFSFVPYEVILRGKTGREALSSSKKIVKYSIAKFTGNMLVMICIMIFINIGLSGFFKLIFSRSTALLSFGELAATIISNILSLWLTVFHFGLYKELEKRFINKS